MPRFDITVAGELNLDLILYGLPDELPPEREFLVDQMMLTPGGSSAIVAHNLAALGSQVGLLRGLVTTNLARSRSTTWLLAVSMSRSFAT